MTNWNNISGSYLINNVADEAVSDGDLSLSGGEGNTKTSWAEMIASTAYDSDYMIIDLIRPYTSFEGDFLIDIGIGGSGLEIEIISNLYGSGNGGAAGGRYIMPISIPSGSRISGRMQNNDPSTGRIIHDSIYLVPSSYSFKGSQKITTYGANESDSGGVQVDPGGTAHTKGVYSEIISSTTYPIKQLYLAFPNKANTARAFATFLVDIAVGSSGNEIVVLENIWFYTLANAGIIPWNFGPIPVSIPIGTRLSVRAQCSITDATDRLFDTIVYGIG